MEQKSNNENFTTEVIAFLYYSISYSCDRLWESIFLPEQQSLTMSTTRWSYLRIV